MSSPSQEPSKSPLQEITQPFIDLIHAPRALWGINLAYVIEGMVYFGMLGYLTIYCSEFIFQAIDGADEAAHYMVMMLTAGITIAMFFLGVVADKRGVRFALIAAFLFMLVGRSIWAGAPTVFGLEPARPTVVAGDKVNLHITKLETRYGNKAVTKAEVLADAENAADVDRDLKLDVSAGEGLVPESMLESRLVQLDHARLIKGEDQEWDVQYGSKPVSARILLSPSKKLGLSVGSTISLDRAYIASIEKKGKANPTANSSAEAASSEGVTTSQPTTELEVATASQPSTESEAKYEYVIRSQWLSDVKAINTFPVDIAAGEGEAPNASLSGWRVALEAATIIEGEGKEWRIQYGQKPVTARLIVDSVPPPPLRAGAIICLNHAQVVKPDAAKEEYAIQVKWPDGVSAVDVAGCSNPNEIRKTLDAQLIPDLSAGAGLPPDEKLAGRHVQLGRARLVKAEGKEWEIEFGTTPISARLRISSGRDLALGPGALISLNRIDIVKLPGETKFSLSARWPDDFAGIDTYGCAEPPYRNLVTAEERDLKVKTRAPVAKESKAAREAAPTTLAALREMDNGAVNVVLRDVYVTYVRNGGYFVQAEKDGPAIFVFVDPRWSSIQIVTMLGILLVVVGYGMYQPAAYAGVRKFTTPKTAAMGFAMLYALMNLGAWLPTFAFLLRDDDYAGLGIPGMFWVYAGFTLFALLATVVILNKRTVIEAETAAKDETARIREEERKQKQDQASTETSAATSKNKEVESERIQPHMWLFWIGGMALFLFKGETPWFFHWNEALWRWVIAGAIFILPAIIAMIPGVKRWIARHPLENAKFAYFIFALIPVQTLFTYNWLVLPPYIKRAFEGWIGEYFEIASNANPILIFIAVPIITALTQKARVYRMMIIGTFVMAAPAFLLAIGPYWWTLGAYIFIMTIGEAMWQPRFLQYAAEIAPEGRTGEYMGVAQLPWFLTKMLVPLLYSGRMMDKFCPAEGPKDTEAMWLIFACIAMASTVLLILAQSWIGKDFKTKHEGA